MICFFQELQITLPVSIPSSKESHAADSSHGSWKAAPKSPIVSPGSFPGNQFALSPPGLSLREIMEEEKSSQQPQSVKVYIVHQICQILFIE